MYYDHDDLDSLIQVLSNIQEEDNKKTHFRLNRRYIVTEGVFLNSGKPESRCSLVLVFNVSRHLKILVFEFWKSEQNWTCAPPLQLEIKSA